MFQMFSFAASALLLTATLAFIIAMLRDNAGLILAALGMEEAVVTATPPASSRVRLVGRTRRLESRPVAARPTWRAAA